MSGSYQQATLPAPVTLMLAFLSDEDAQRLNDAFQFAAAAHAEHTRDEGTPYIDHPVRVAQILWEELGNRDIDLLIAALNHDVLEDCEWLEPSVLESMFGPDVTSMVLDVTKEQVPDEQNAARDRAYLDRLPNLSHKSRLLKLADRIDNLRNVPQSGDPAKARRYLAVSREEFIPLALATDQTAARLVIEACDAIEEYLGTV